MPHLQVWVEVQVQVRMEVHVEVQPTMRFFMTLSTLQKPVEKDTGEPEKALMNPFLFFWRYNLG